MNLKSKHLVIILIFFNLNSFAQDLKIAVASNFIKPIKEIATLYENSTGTKILISAGSSGKHYSQIIHGAPFDIFFSADTLRPYLLEKNGIAKYGRYSYAKGILVLWSNTIGLNSNIENLIFEHIAIANPKLAPYGKAAKQYLNNIGLWKKFSNKIVMGENISQTFQFVKSKNAQVGLVAYSQIISSGILDKNFIKISSDYYKPIIQQLVIINSNSITEDFIKFVQSDVVQKIIIKYGYDLP